MRQQREFDVAPTDAELDAFTMNRTWADLRMIDGAIDASDRKAPWCYDGEPKRANSGVFEEHVTLPVDHYFQEPAHQRDQVADLIPD